jgi:aspartate aminotransferase
MVTMQIPSPAGSIPPSCLHEVFRAAEDRERVTGKQIIKLHVGEPWFDPPPEAVEAFVAAVRDGRTGYTSAEGLLELREAIAAKLISQNGLRTAPDRIIVTPGSCQGLAALMQSLAVPGDELLLPELHWPIHLQQCLLAGLRPVFYPLDDQFRPDLARLAGLASARTRAIIVNSPANPTGSVLPRAHLTAVLETARSNGWFVISDEAYEHFVFDGEHVSLASLERDLPERERIVFSTFSFSKSFAMTGYRLGYVVAPTAATAQALRVVQEASIICPQSPAQYAGIAALGVEPAGRGNGDLVRANRDRSLPRLHAAGLLPVLPAGGWYAMLDVARTGLDAARFAAELLQAHNVAVASGSGFALRPTLDGEGRVTAVTSASSADTLVRLAFCGDPEELDLGVHALVEFAVGVMAGAAAG